MPTILIVDDRAVIRRLISISLSKDYEILEAEDSVSAMKLIQSHSPQVVFLDVMMRGEMDGLQLLDEIKGNPLTRSIKVAMVTGRGLAEDSDDALKRGADAYFVKPFGLREMQAWVQNVLK